VRLSRLTKPIVRGRWNSFYGIYIAECPSIPGCVSQGKTLKEAEKNIQAAIKEPSPSNNLKFTFNAHDPDTQAQGSY
jgi:hypothetical protein